MRLSWWYWLLVAGWHVLLLALSYKLLEEHYAWFIGVQVLAVFSLWQAYRLYRRLVGPLLLIESGKAALLDQDFSIKFRETGSKELDGLVKIYNRMIETLREERVKSQSQQQFLQKLIAAAPSGILIMDFDGLIVQANPAITELLGLDPVGHRIEELSHPVLTLCQQLKRGESATIKLGAADHYRVESSSFMDRGFERQFIQVQGVSQQVLTAEKRAYGKVIRMMAHEVNNSIGAVNALLQAFAETTGQGDETWVQDVQEGLPIAIQRNDRLNLFMRNFADVVRLPEPQLERTDLMVLLKNCANLLTPQATQQNTTLTVELPTYPVWVMLDAQQLEQAFINMIKNALESLQKGGQINISYDPQAHQITIADNGPGIPPELADKLFTPFFSSKPDGQGVGLTLIREILTQHQFRFDLKTHADGWTRFAVRLG